ncbi:hemoglobin [Pacificibacter maritimus]|uniref:Hemoglobin n=1 Tax=Pacificibacter maritimus TaxID=762213 RepID=A0A3N4UF78_9RHOB|nr:group III truncated hemoglobin [Pacificibacter maritimus]RPE67115.1 hemoglobin [Pacificibacter maritimus]
MNQERSLKPAQKFPITSSQIDLVVAKFYARLRIHPDLAPIFANHIEDWPPHEHKISQFWHNAIGMKRGYTGNPQQTHMKARDIKTAHFAIWLAIFDEVLYDCLPRHTAQCWSELAHRIGRALKISIAQRDIPTDAPPQLS